MACVEPEPIGTLVGCLVPAFPARWSMNYICEKHLCPVCTVKCILYGFPLPMPENTAPNPARRVKIREACTVMRRLAGGVVLPLPFHSVVLAFCHIVHVCYGCTTLANVAWQATGLVYT